MAPDLTAIKSALAELTDAELHALIAATNGVPPVVYGLLAWLDGACEWELNRRRGFDYPLQPPEAAIPPEEDAVSIDAAMAMRVRTRGDARNALAERNGGATAQPADTRTRPIRRFFPDTWAEALQTPSHLMATAAVTPFDESSPQR